MNFLIFCAGLIVVIGIVGGIAQVVLKQKNNNGSSPSPLVQRVRQYQDEQENMGWRIEMIPYDDPFKPMMIQTNWLAVIGAIAFLVGFGLLALHKIKLSLGLGLTFGGVAVALLGICSKARNARKDWQVVTAHCIDRELQKIQVESRRDECLKWFWRIVCEYQYDGKEIRVTPNVYWRGFQSEEAAKKFLDEHILPNGECKLHINPKNLLQTELVGQGIKDKLLY